MVLEKEGVDGMNLKVGDKDYGNVVSKTNVTYSANLPTDFKDYSKHLKSVEATFKVDPPKVIWCHPDNKKILVKKIEQITKSHKSRTLLRGEEDYVLDTGKDVFYQPPFRIKTNEYFPKTDFIDEIKYKKTKFVDYSIKTSELGWTEYEEMCLYFGWAEKVKVEVLAFYDIKEEQITMKNILSSSFKDIMINKIQKDMEYNFINNGRLTWSG